MLSTWGKVARKRARPQPERREQPEHLRKRAAPRPGVAITEKIRLSRQSGSDVPLSPRWCLTDKQ